MVNKDDEAKKVIGSRIDSNPPKPVQARVMSNPPAAARAQARVDSNPPRGGAEAGARRWSQVKARINTQGGAVKRHSKESEQRLRIDLQEKERRREEIQKKIQERQAKRIAQQQPQRQQQQRPSGDKKWSGPQGDKRPPQRPTGDRRITKDIEHMNETEKLDYFKAQEWEETKKTRIGRLCQSCRRRWRWFQGYYPPRGGAPVPPPPPYVPPNASVKDTGWARQLKAAMDIRIIRYPEPFAELLLTSNYLEPKNYKIMVNKKVLFYSYDYTPYISNLTHYLQPFSQIILDPDDNVTLYQECYKFPNEVICCFACLDCRKIKIRRNKIIYYMRAPNGCYMGRIERNRPCAHCLCQLSFDIYNRKDELILFVSRKNSAKFNIKAPKGKTRIGLIRRRLAPESKSQLFPNHYDYKILLDDHNQNNIETKFLIIGVTFFIDFLLDKNYRPFIRFGSRLIPTFNSRYKQ